MCICETSRLANDLCVTNPIVRAEDCKNDWAASMSELFTRPKQKGCDDGNREVNCTPERNEMIIFWTTTWMNWRGEHCGYFITVAVLLDDFPFKSEIPRSHQMAKVDSEWPHACRRDGKSMPNNRALDITDSSLKKGAECSVEGYRRAEHGREVG